VCDYNYVEFGLVIGYVGYSQFLITIQSNSISQTWQFTTTLTETSRSAAPSLVLWYRLKTADVPIPGFPYCPVPQPQQVLTHSELSWNSVALHMLRSSPFGNCSRTATTCHSLRPPIIRNLLSHDNTFLLSWSWSYISADGQSASLFRCRAPFGAGDEMLYFFELHIPLRAMSSYNYEWAK
jgi:hypothetical protein